MSENEMQRKMEFIVEQQALFVSDLQKLQEEQAKSESRISRLEGAVVAVVNMIGDLAKAQKTTDAKFNAMTERLDQVTAQIVAKLLHEPTVRMKEAAAEGGGEAYTATIRRLFGLEEPA